MSEPIRVAVLTVSDRCSRGAAMDTSGPALEAMCRERLGARIVAAICVPDDVGQVEETLRDWVAHRPAIDLIVTTGGTGLAPRDHTPEAAMRVIERPHSGLMELARLRCFERTPRTFLSRGVAGAAGKSLILTLPGSRRGASETLGALLDILPHAIETLRGEVKDDGRPEATDSGDGKVIHHLD